MNLNAIAAGVVAAVNPFTPATLQLSLGYTTNPDGSRTPKYAQPVIPVLASVQSTPNPTLHQTDGLNLQGEQTVIYLNGDVSGLVRVSNKGGDLITIAVGPRRGVFLVTAVVEQWPDWCKVTATLQNGS